MTVQRDSEHDSAGQKLDEFDEQIINNYIGGSFRDMQQFGPRVYRPFMQASTSHAPPSESLTKALKWSFASNPK